MIGACLAPDVDGGRLITTLVAFFAAVGIAAHALDELHGRPLRTEISSRALVIAAALGLAVAVAIGVVGVVRVGWVLLPFVVVGPVLALAYNLEWFGGVVHTDVGFALELGCVPRGHRVRRADRHHPRGGDRRGRCGNRPVAPRSGHSALRRARCGGTITPVDGSMVQADGTVVPITHASLLAPLEFTLRALSWSVIALAVALAVARFM